MLGPALLSSVVQKVDPEKVERHTENATNRFDTKQRRKMDRLRAFASFAFEI